MIFASDSSVLIPIGDEPSLENTTRVLSLFEKLRGAHPAIQNLHPAYNSLLVDFDSNQYDPHEFKRFMETEVKTASTGLRTSGRVIEIPVCYDGEDFEEIEKHTGLKASEIIRLHSSAQYTVAFLGFSPGFPYLFGLPKELECPRKLSPRTRVPAGSVAIAGRQSGIYPTETPGGWQCLGRTDVRLFDWNRTERSLLQPGDLVKFVPVPEITDNHSNELPGLKHSVFEVFSGEIFTSLQSTPQQGLAHLGVSPGGAADCVALRIGNRLVGNQDSAVALEVTGQKCGLRFLQDTWVTVTGADCSPVLDHQVIKTWTALPVSRGQILTLNEPKHHWRSYVCVHDPKKSIAAPGFRRADSMRELYSKPVTVLQSTFGAQVDWFEYDSVVRFFETEFEVSPESNRLGVRLEAQEFRLKEPRELVSEGIPNGSIQIANGGQAMILFCEQQTTGGYPKLASVTWRDLHWIGQLRPGQKLRFQRVDLDQAWRANLSFENTLQKAVDVF